MHSSQILHLLQTRLLTRHHSAIHLDECSTSDGQSAKLSGLALGDCNLIGHVIVEGPPDVNPIGDEAVSVVWPALVQHQADVHIMPAFQPLRTKLLVNNAKIVLKDIASYGRWTCDCSDSSDLAADSNVKEKC